jgi:hypothetical protein
MTFPQADFNDLQKIKKHKRSKTIIKRMADLINATPKGASIYASPDRLESNMDELIAAIRRADIRGVDLHIMLDMSSPGNRRANELTVDKLKTIDKNIDLVLNRITPDGSGVNHNKFALFSKVKTTSGMAKHIVFTTSQNSFPNAQTKNQNAVSMASEGLYGAYLDYWKKMKLLTGRDGRGMEKYMFKRYSDPEGGIYALFWPKTKNGKYYGSDPFIDILGDITDPSSTTIQIVMAGWTGCRRGIVEKLDDLMSKGAKVEVVAKSNASQVIYDGLVALVNKGAFIKMYNYSGDPDVKQIRTHSKVMMIRGEWKGVKTNVVITGSENFNCPGLKRSLNNSIILSSHNFKHPKLFQRFEDHFNKIKTLPGVCCMEKN